MRSRRAVVVGSAIATFVGVAVSVALFLTVRWIAVYRPGRIRPPATGLLALVVLAAGVCTWILVVWILVSLRRAPEQNAEAVPRLLRWAVAPAAILAGAVGLLALWGMVTDVPGLSWSSAVASLAIATAMTGPLLLRRRRRALIAVCCVLAVCSVPLSIYLVVPTPYFIVVATVMAMVMTSAALGGVTSGSSARPDRR